MKGIMAINLIKILLLVMIIGGIAYFLMGCSSLKTPLKPSIVGINPDGDANAFKVNELNGIKASLDKMEKMALIDKSNTETIGGNKSVVNDSELLKFIFEKWYLIVSGLFGFLLSLFGGIWAMIKFVMWTYEERIKLLIQGHSKEIQSLKLWLQNLQKSNAEKETKLDIWQQSQIEKLINGKRTT